MTKLSILILILALSSNNVLSEEDYLWRDYNGTVPDDAIEGGYDSNGDDFFIGQAKIENVGEVVGPIYPNKTFVEVPLNDNEIKKVSTSIKILCGNSPPVDWKRANRDDLHIVLLNNAVVLGGKLEKKGYLYIGRIFYENEVKLGPILASELEDAHLYFAHNGRVLRTSGYQVLVDNSPDVGRFRRRRFRGSRRRL